MNSILEIAECFDQSSLELNPSGGMMESNDRRNIAPRPNASLIAAALTTLVPPKNLTTVENTLFHGDTAVETSIFAIKVTFKDGRPSVVTRGRAMVVYVKYKDSPTGWASIREMTQAAPEQK